MIRGEVTEFHGAKFCTELTNFDGSGFYGDRTDFLGSTFSGKGTVFNSVTFDAARTRFARVRFDSSVVSFHMAHFNSADTAFDDARFGSEEVLFSEATFKDKVSFLGTSENAIFGPRTWLRFDHSRMDKPELLTFSTVVLHPGWFINVDVRKVNFTDVKWYGLPDGPKGNLKDDSS